MLLNHNKIDVFLKWTVTADEEWVSLNNVKRKWSICYVPGGVGVIWSSTAKLLIPSCTVTNWTV